MSWCEGSKRDRDCRVEFVNSDPIRSKGIGENRIRARVSLHEQDDATGCKEYWKKVTSLVDPNLLLGSVRRASIARFPLPYGTLTIRYNSTKLLHRIKRDIRDLAQELLQS
jgi:hypothetical protein